MNKFGKNNKNNFFGDVYKKAAPIRLGIDGGDYGNKQSPERVLKDDTEKSVKEPERELKLPLSEHRTQMKTHSEERQTSNKESELQHNISSRTSESEFRRTHMKPPEGSGPRKPVKPKKRRTPIWVIATSDILAACLIFLLFYVLYFTDTALPDDSTPTTSVSDVVNSIPTEDISASPEGTQSEAKPSATAVSSPAATIDPNNWRTKFASEFSTDGKVHQKSTADTWTYQSANIDVNVTKKTDSGVVYFVTDIYVADIKYFKTWYSNKRQFVSDALKSVNGVVGINGDFYPVNNGLTIRNGQYVAYAKTSADELVMYTDGTMQAFTASNFNYKDIKAQAPDKVYQVWAFGPSLLDGSGQALKRFNSTVTGANNPRTAIGFYEPGHYCFVTVDGRQQGYSYPGYSMAQLASLMQSLGCKVAYNLDGGGSTQLAFMENEINHACGDKRMDHDIIYITDQG